MSEIVSKKILDYLKNKYGNQVSGITLSKGRYAIVDEEDLPKLLQKGWHINKKYAVGTDNLSMHRFIMHVDPKNRKIAIDHINLEGLDNRKANLRICTVADNQRNRGVHKDNKTGYKGVRFDPTCTRTLTYKAYITYNYKSIHLGNYKCPMDAAKAYDKKALELFGEFALTNKMLGLL